MTIKKAKRKLPLHDYSIVKATVPGIANTNQKLMLQAASEFGLTPSSRSRIVAGNAKGKEPEDEMEALLGGDA